MPDYEIARVFLDHFLGWARNEPAILGAALVGSYARRTETPTSDIDLVIIAQQPEIYLNQPAWLSLFGQVERTQLEDYG